MRGECEGRGRGGVCVVCACVCAAPWAIKRNNKAHEAYFTHVFVAFITISSMPGRVDCWHATPSPPLPLLAFSFSSLPHCQHLLPTYEILKQTRRIRGNFYCIFSEHFLPIVCKSACHADVPISPLPSPPPLIPLFRCSLMWQSF